MTAGNGKARTETHDGWEEPAGERLLWYPRYLFDYHRKTADLTFAEHGAYTLLMDAYYANQGPLRADEARLRRRLGISGEADPVELEALRFVVKTFFREKNGYLIHERMQEEIDRAHRIIKAKRKSGSAGGTAKARNEAQVRGKVVSLRHEKMAKREDSEL